MAQRLKKITAAKPGNAGRPGTAINDNARIRMSSPDKTMAETYDGTESAKMKMKGNARKSISDLIFTSPHPGMGKPKPYAKGIAGVRK